MNWRAYRACVRRELQRGRTSLVIFTTTGLVGIALVMLVHGDLAVLPGVLAFVFGLFAVFAPSAGLARDRLLGHFEFDRALPLPPRLVAAGWLTGAGIRTLPFSLGVLALALGIAKDSDSGSGLSTILVIVVTLTAMLLGFVLCWTLLALNARWAFRRIWWLGPTLGLAPQLLPAILPEPVKHAIAGIARDIAAGFTTIISTPPGLLAVLVVAAMIPLMVFSGATLLFASGLRRYRFDPTAMQHGINATTRLELGAVGRGPVLAVARLRLRLSLEQFRRELLMIVILLLVVTFNPGGLRTFASTYVRVLAALIPGGIVIQLGAARSRGDLETMQHLPHPAWVIGLGHLAAIAVMAIPGVTVLLIGRAVTGVMPSVAESLGMWGWFVMMAWVAAVLTVWLRAWYAAVLVGVPLLLGGGWLLLVGFNAAVPRLTDAWHRIAALRAQGGALLPLALMLLVVVVGLPIFANGLARYTYQAR